MDSDTQGETLTLYRGREIPTAESIVEWREFAELTHDDQLCLIQAVIALAWGLTDG